LARFLELKLPLLFLIFLDFLFVFIVFAPLFCADTKLGIAKNNAINREIFVNIEINLVFMKQIYNSFLMFSVFLVNILLTSCGDKDVHPIPNVAVSIIINLDLPAYQSLNNVGGWAYVNGGSKGIVVYRTFENFIALDRHSTYDPTADCSIATVDSTNFFVLNDGCSVSEYNIMDGTVTKGPAKWGLKSYATSWDGQHSVIITN
jgi:hypothetical protein